VLVRRPELYEAPKGEEPPPWWIRAILIFTCTGVSFAHGSNDGQKGMGLIMLILIGVVPGMYAVNVATSSADMTRLVATVNASVMVTDRLAAGKPMDDKTAQAALTRYMRSGKLADDTLPALDHDLRSLETQLAPVSSLKDVPEDARRVLRADIYMASESIGKLVKGNALQADDKKVLSACQSQLKAVTTFIPVWVKAAVALALGLGTMIGWKRIVVTVGERIGKAHLTYAQGASAELVAMATISAADVLGLPVSTTHVLSSGIAGTMFANRSGLQKETIQKILMAWVLTIPVCVFLGAMLFSGMLYLSFHIFGG
jgi:PiT family inorganic phosphate transporter